MNKQQRMKAELKVVRALKYWEDADIFKLDTKKKIAEMVVAELEDYFGVERGLQMSNKLNLTYEEYVKLRSVPVEELSEEDQELRMRDFKNRVEIGMEFIRGIFKGYISKSVVDKFPDDDPLKEETETIRIMFNHKKRTNMIPEA